MQDRYATLREAANALAPEQYAAKLAEHLEQKRKRLAARGLSVQAGRVRFIGYTFDPDTRELREFELSATERAEIRGLNEGGA